MTTSLPKWLKFPITYSSNIQKRSKTAFECHKIVFIRHGQSEWNLKNQFCGWFDAHLSDQGRAEAKQAGKRLKDLKIKLHHGFTSKLCRSIQTLDIILKQLREKDLPVEQHWRLNERHYGNLTGMNKAEAMELFGKEKVHIWRRSYKTRPPKILDVNPHYCDIQTGERYGLKDSEVPECESLADTVARTLPYWLENIVPEIKKGKTVIVAAHGNSLRGIVKHIEGITDEGIQHLNLPTGVPFVYTLGADMMALKDDNAVEFYGNDEQVEAVMKDLRKAKSPDEKKTGAVGDC
ncbi:phosphoglycerate mutase 2-like [Atheta coriaria]|uniref:phosphoglycerate mutase 2-like n=1 Tax=Dalotia coriaria TaxID=877792 RepID=UPI0031F38F0D